MSRGWNRAIPAASRGVFVCAAAAYKKGKISAPSEETAQGVRDEIVDKKGLKGSVVWRYFVLLKSDTKQSSVHCKLCRAHVPTKTENTTNEVV